MVKNKRVVSGCGCGVRGCCCGGAGRGEAADRSRPGAGLGNELCGALSAWRRPWSVRDPGKVMADPAVRATLGGRCLSDLSPRREKEILGSVASDPMVSRLVGDPDRPRRGRRGRRGRARKTARQRAWAPAGEHSSTAGVWADRPPVIDIGATLVGVHSEKWRGWPRPFKKGLGDRPPDRMVRPRRDHPPGTGPGRPAPRPGRRVLARTDGAGGTKETIEPLTRRRASCSVGVHPARPHTADPRAPSPRPPGHPRTTPTATPGTGRTPPRPADPPDLTAWPQGMRANRAPRAAPSGGPAALRGHRGSHRPTALATNTKGGRLPGLEVRHRLRTRRQGTASAARKTPGSTTSLRRASRRTASDARSWPRPADLPTFSQTPALADASARAWEPRTIHLRLTSIPAAITHHTRRTVPHHKTDHPRNTLPLDNLRHLQTPPTP